MGRRTVKRRRGVEAVAEGLERRMLLSGGSAEVVQIPDAQLEAAVREALHMDTGDITQANMASLRMLSATGIGSIAGLEYATNLEELYVDGGSVSDVLPLSGLSKLTKLRLEENEISDVSPLSGLKQLVSLNVNYNQIGDLSPLTGLASLQELVIGANPLVDVTPVRELASLTSLDCSFTSNVEFSVLAGLKNLTQLDLEACQISDLSWMAGLTNLTELRLGTNSITDVSPLAGLTKLSQLRLHWNAISDTSPLVGLENLTSLELGFNQISDLSPLVGMAGLRFLGLAGNSIRDISPLAKMTQLLSVSLYANYLYVGPGSAAMQAIGAMAANGTGVEYSVQRVLIGNTDEDGVATVRRTHDEVEIFRSADTTGKPDFESPSDWGGLAVEVIGGAGRLIVDLSDQNPFEHMMLTVTPGTTKLEIGNGPGALVMPVPAFEENGKLDVAGCSLVLTSGGSVEALANRIVSGQLFSSTARGREHMGLAVILNDQGDGTEVRTELKGVAVMSDDILVTETWNGDANLDGVVNADDYFLIDSGYVTQKGGWYNGDFNYDGVVNADDYFLIDSAYTGQAGTLGVQGVQGCRVAGLQGSRGGEEGVVEGLFGEVPIY